MSDEKVDELLLSLEQAHQDIQVVSKRLDSLSSRKGLADSVRGWTAVAAVCIAGLFWLFQNHSRIEHHVSQKYHDGALEMNEVLIEVKTNQKRIISDIEALKKGLENR